MNRSARHSGGFTLMELVLVMVIALTAIAIAAPSLRGWSRGAKLRDAGDEVLTMVRYARSMSITDGVLYRIEFNTREGKYQLKKQKGTDFVDVARFPKEISILEGGKMELTVETKANLAVEGDNKECVNFYPTGRTQTSVLRISDGHGFEVEIRCDSPAEDFYQSYEGVQRNS